MAPKIVPWFLVNKKKIKNIAARRSRSLAITSENEVYEWGFVGSEGTQFKKIVDLPGPCKDVQIGLEFNLFLLEDGSVYMFGAITQEGMNVLQTFDKLICITEGMSVKFTQI